jgi:glycosyltransferase involved in cell wall biosynthesis
MKIGIDARLIEETGVGRYIKNLLDGLSRIDTVNEYVIFLPPDSYPSFSLKNPRWQKRLVLVRWHTVLEQIVLPFVFAREKLDLLHVPYFTVPLLYPGKIIVTIHDITILNHPTGKSTTLPYPLYLLKWLAYNVILRIGIHKALSVITVSHAVKKELQKQLFIPEDKITVTYEGIDPVFLSKQKKKKSLPFEYFLYVGNVYPHKQAEFLIRSYKKFIDKRKNKTSEMPRLVFVGKRDFFYERLAMLVNNLRLSDIVILKHGVSDQELKSLYKYSLALLFPSASEGFGLPALEALSQHAVVVVSDIAVFRELLGEYAVFVKHDEDEWANALEQVFNRKYIGKNADEFLKRYSWNQLSIATKTLYEHSACV